VWSQFSLKTEHVRSGLSQKMSLGPRNLFAARAAQSRKRNLVRACLLAQAAAQFDISAPQLDALRHTYKAKTAAELDRLLDTLLRTLRLPAAPKPHAAPRALAPKPVARSPLPMPPPVPPRPLPKGQESSVTVHGKPYTFYRQDREMECGPSCVNMVFRAHNRAVPQDIARREVGAHDARQGGVKDWDTSASNLEWLTSALTKGGLQAHTEKTGKLDYLKRHLFDQNHALFSPQHPGILRIQWDPWWDGAEWIDGGGHFVTCLGMAGGPGSVDLLDPYASSGHVELRQSDFPVYRPGYGSLGKLDPWWYLSTLS